MRGWNEELTSAGPHDGILPRSTGVSIAALGALLCWIGLFGIIAFLN